MTEAEQKDLEFLSAVERADAERLSRFVEENREKQWFPADEILFNAFVTAATSQKEEICKILSQIKSAPKDGDFVHEPKETALASLMTPETRSAFDMHLKCNFQEKPRFIPISILSHLDELQYSTQSRNFEVTEELLEEIKFYLLLYVQMSAEEETQKLGALNTHFVFFLDIAKQRPNFEAKISDFLDAYLTGFAKLEVICDWYEETASDVIAFLTSNDEGQTLLRKGNERELILRLAALDGFGLRERKSLEKSFNAFVKTLERVGSFGTLGGYDSDEEFHKGDQFIVLSHHPFFKTRVKECGLLISNDIFQLELFVSLLNTAYSEAAKISKEAEREALIAKLMLFNVLKAYSKIPKTMDEREKEEWHKKRMTNLYRALEACDGGTRSDFVWDYDLLVSSGVSEWFSDSDDNSDLGPIHEAPLLERLYDFVHPQPDKDKLDDQARDDFVSCNAEFEFEFESDDEDDNEYSSRPPSPRLG